MPEKRHSAKVHSPLFFLPNAVCHTRQTLCRVQKGLCRVYSTLGKQGQSGSGSTYSPETKEEPGLPRVQWSSSNRLIAASAGDTWQWRLQPAPASSAWRGVGPAAAAVNLRSQKRLPSATWFGPPSLVAPRPRTLRPPQCRSAVALTATPSPASHWLPPAAPPHLSALRHVRYSTLYVIDVSKSSFYRRNELSTMFLCCKTISITF